MAAAHAFESDEGVYYAFVRWLREQPPETVADIKTHLEQENFHPDVEFTEIGQVLGLYGFDATPFGLEDMVSADDFIEAVICLHDIHTCRPKPALALV